MTDSIQIAIPCFAGTGAKEARDDRSKGDRCTKEARSITRLNVLLRLITPVRAIPGFTPQPLLRGDCRYRAI